MDASEHNYGRAFISFQSDVLLEQLSSSEQYLAAITSEAPYLEAGLRQAVEGVQDAKRHMIANGFDEAAGLKSDAGGVLKFHR
jgi:hypothetical protein